jgi:membrane-bound serine protease (ClpP class)
LGALFLFDPADADYDLRIAWPVIAGAAVTSALLSIGAFGLAIKARQRAVVTGAEEMLGSLGTVIEWQDDRGRILVHGEVWSARAGASLAKGDSVRIVRREGLTLFVEPASKESRHE